MLPTQTMARPVAAGVPQDPFSFVKLKERVWKAVEHLRWKDP